MVYQSLNRGLFYGPVELSWLLLQYIVLSMGCFTVFFVNFLTQFNLPACSQVVQDVCGSQKKKPLVLVLLSSPASVFLTLHQWFRGSSDFWSLSVPIQTTSQTVVSDTYHPRFSPSFFLSSSSPLSSHQLTPIRHRARSIVWLGRGDSRWHTHKHTDSDRGSEGDRSSLVCLFDSQPPALTQRSSLLFSSSSSSYFSLCSPYVNSLEIPKVSEACCSVSAWALLNTTCAQQELRLAACVFGVQVSNVSHVWEWGHHLSQRLSQVLFSSSRLDRTLVL